MNKGWSLGVKLSIFALVAIVFALGLIALSGKYHKSEASTYDNYSFSDGKQEYDQEFTVSENDNLYVDADFGDLSIVGSTDNKVHVQVKMKGDQDQIERYPVKIEQEGNTVRVTSRHRSSHFNFFDINNLQAKYEIAVPKNFNLEVSTAGGNIHIENVKGELRGSTSGGDLDLMRLDGDMKITTSGGNIRAGELSGTIDVETSGGDVRIENVTGKLKAETSGGNIKLYDIDAEVNASTSGGNIKASLLSNKGVRLATSGGNVTVALPDSIQADVYADASGGNVSCDLPFQGKMKDDNMRGTINGGGNEINLETSGGSIEINSRNE